MKHVRITFNPYKVNTEIIVEDKTVRSDSSITQYLNKRLQEWVEKIPEFLRKDYNDNNFELVFHGTALDYADLEAAIETSWRGRVTYTLQKEEAQEYAEKEIVLQNIIAQIDKAQLPDLESLKTQNLLKEALNEDLEVKVLASDDKAGRTLVKALKLREHVFGEESKEKIKFSCVDIHNVKDTLIYNSEMLVIYIMDLDKLYEPMQDAFMKKISEKMKKGGQQSRESFLFVIDIDSSVQSCEEYYEDEDEATIDIKQDKVQPVIDRLKNKGIENPYIFVTSGLSALQAMDEVKKPLEWERENIANPLSQRTQWQLERYARMPQRCRENIENELKRAVFTQILIHSGICSIENMLHMYIVKYLRPQVIRQAANALNANRLNIDKVRSSIKAKKDESLKLEEDIRELEIKIKKLEQNNSKGMDANYLEQLEKILSKFHITDDFKTDLGCSYRGATEGVKRFFDPFYSRQTRGTMNQQEGREHIRHFENYLKQIQQDFHNDVKTSIQKCCGNLSELSRKHLGRTLDYNLSDFEKLDKWLIRNPERIIDEASRHIGRYIDRVELDNSICREIYDQIDSERQRNTDYFSNKKFINTRGTIQDIKDRDDELTKIRAAKSQVENKRNDLSNQIVELEQRLGILSNIKEAINSLTEI